MKTLMTKYHSTVIYVAGGFFFSIFYPHCNNFVSIVLAHSLLFFFYYDSVMGMYYSTLH